MNDEDRDFNLLINEIKNGKIAMSNLKDNEIYQNLLKTSCLEEDAILIAYEWLDAQEKIRSINENNIALKHQIENWASRYVSASDVEVAAALHPNIIGSYQFYNISKKYILPNKNRIKHIPSAFKMSYSLNEDNKKSLYGNRAEKDIVRCDSVKINFDTGEEVVLNESNNMNICQ
jgi:hypothetical protein